MKTGGQWRQRRPLGSVFVGQAPQKPSGCCLLPLAQYGCPIGRKGLRDGQQVYRPNMAKRMAKNCQKTHKIDCKSSKRHPIWPMRVII